MTEKSVCLIIYLLYIYKVSIVIVSSDFFLVVFASLTTLLKKLSLDNTHVLIAYTFLH